MGSGVHNLIHGYFGYCGTDEFLGDFYAFQISYIVGFNGFPHRSFLQNCCFSSFQGVIVLVGCSKWDADGSAFLFDFFDPDVDNLVLRCGNHHRIGQRFAFLQLIAEHFRIRVYRYANGSLLDNTFFPKVQSFIFNIDYVKGSLYRFFNCSGS
ncbi:hypothetical protein SDC9_191201 [bioreactor metagenome]|uniref:Uncharacterized protein n=1 Tax=bioreactor metagenome TaxID=1076179 RepID=A0A645HX66_9ZZZZ